MGKEARIKLGLEWKRKLLANEKGANFIVPKSVTMNHPYIKMAETEAKKPEEKPPKDKDKEKEKK